MLISIRDKHRAEIEIQDGQLEGKHVVSTPLTSFISFNLYLNHLSPSFLYLSSFMLSYFIIMLALSSLLSLSPSLSIPLSHHRHHHLFFSLHSFLSPYYSLQQLAQSRSESNGPSQLVGPVDQPAP